MKPFDSSLFIGEILSGSGTTTSQPQIGDPPAPTPSSGSGRRLLKPRHLGSSLDDKKAPEGNFARPELDTEPPPPIRQPPARFDPRTSDKKKAGSSTFGSSSSSTKSLYECPAVLTIGLYRLCQASTAHINSYPSSLSFCV